MILYIVLQIDPDLFDNKMVLECYPNCAGTEADNPNINDDEAVRGIRVFLVNTAYIFPVVINVPIDVSAHAQ